MLLTIGLPITRRGLLTPQYNGPLDQLEATARAAWSVDWLLTREYEGPAVELRESAGSTLEDIGFTTAGDLDTAAAAAHIGGGAGTLRTIYDQVAAANLVQTTAANMPAYNAAIAALNDRPGAVCSDTGDRMTGTLAVALSGNADFTMVFVGQAKGDAPVNSLRGGFFTGDASHSATIGASTLSGENRWWFGGAFNAPAGTRVGTADTGHHLYVHRHGSGQSLFEVDGATVASGVSNTCNFDNGTVGFNTYDGSNGAGLPDLCTAILFASAISDGDLALLEAALATRYGIALP